MVEFKPASEYTTNANATSGTLNQIIPLFQTWVELVVGYNSVKISKEEEFLEDSANEFYSDFTIADDNADNKAFDTEKQFVLYQLLEFAKQNIEDAEVVDTEQAANIIKEIKLLQASIPSITKAVAIRGLAKIFAKTKALSIKLAKDFFDVAKKEAIKAALYGSLHEANTFLHTIHLLP